MKLRQILTEEPNPVTDQDWLYKRLALISSDAMLERGMFQEHAPFLYAPTAQHRTLYVGDGQNKIRYHYEFRAIANPSDAKLIEAAYTGDAPGAAGRLGFGLLKVPSDGRSLEPYPMPNLTLAAFYKHCEPQMVNDCTRQLIERKYIDNRTLVSYRGTIYPAAELASKGRDAEPRERPTAAPGRPTWQGEMEKVGAIGPGQKWWAPTSESRQ